MSSIVKVPSERLNPYQVRELARKNWGLTKSQMCGMHVHHFPPRSEGGKDIPEHLYICSPEMHKNGWHDNAYYMNNLMKAVKNNTGRKQSEETCRKKSEALKGRNVGHSYEGGERHPNSKRVNINGVSYVSQQEASEKLGITIQGISYRMKNWGPERGYCYE
jgi:hypothetical protein